MANNEGTGQQSSWQSNRELNVQENSSVTNDVLGDNDSTETAQSQWRPTEEGFTGASQNQTIASQSPAQTSEVDIQNSETGNKTGDPGRTPGKAEGEEDFERGGNE